MKTFTVKLVAVTVGLIPGMALAQQPYVAGVTPVVSGSDFVSPGFFPGWGYHSSTAMEGRLRGEAALWQGIGQYNLDTARAAIAAEQARAMARENHAAEVETYFKLKEMNQSYRAAMRGPRVTHQDAVRISKAAVPKRLDAYQLDQVFGEVRWPAVLEEREFAATRERVENLFRDRDVSNSGTGSRNEAMIQRAVADMETILVSRIDVMEPSEYMSARNFFRSLAYEAGFVPGATSIAATR